MTEFNRIQAFRYLDGVADGLNESRKDIIEELEKIKKKIKKIYDDEYLSNLITTKTLNVIDERIAELKGE